MFKKERDLTERSKTLLKNNEVKSFKADLLKHCSGITEDDLNAVIPNKANVTLTKLANKTLLYSMDNIVLAFDVGGRSNLYPSLAFLWRFPDALPAFTVHSPVSEFVLRGADLMVPGLAMLQGLDGVQAGGKVAVKVKNDPLPFAVGEAAVSFETLAAQGQRKGKAMNVLHVYGDLITPAKSLPNSGFSSSRIYGLVADGSSCESDDDAEAPAVTEATSSDMPTSSNANELNNSSYAVNNCDHSSL